MKYKNVRFEYYEVVYRTKDSTNNKDKLFDLVRWINKANKINALIDRTYDFYSEKARLEKAQFDDDFNYYFLHFVRLGDNIPSKGKLDGKVEPLELDDDEYIGNEVTALYDEDHHILMLQRNRSSLGPSGVEFYLNRLWDNEEETIHLRPIAPKGMFENVKKAEKFRKIHLKFADIHSKKPAGNGPVIAMLNNFGKFEGVTGEVVISVGRTKDKSLDSQTMIDTIQDIMDNQDNGLMKKAELHYKYTDDTAVEIVDLFAKKTHDFGSFQMEKRTTLSHEAIAEKMHEIYHQNNKKRKILDYLMKE
ncbi:hypothetical protein SAMN06295960_4659 [Paenibacillus aquistagni]|uniref:Uncharacterized protein n=2 Tax=Paenibacillus aquistagni TaxID=1852522 RepID=A0A1X7LWS0_9BACL|nr:hypothetical protein SAMN06295960_4659 [Paenibacillus aquistagni]